MYNINTIIYIINQFFYNTIDTLKDLEIIKIAKLIYCRF